MARSPRYLTSYWLKLSDLRIKQGSETSRAIVRTVNAVCAAPVLPLPGDGTAPPPADAMATYEQTEGRALASVYWRRVRGHRLYVWYRDRGRSHVDIVTVTRSVP